MRTDNIPPPPDAPPPEHNPEALEDIERGTFRNVDLGSPDRQPQPQPTAAASVKSMNASEKTLILGSIASPFASMSFKDQLALLSVFSLVVLIQSSVNCGNNYYPCTETNGFAVAAGTVSLFFCLGFFFLEARKLVEEIHRTYISIFMFLWWASSMIALTFFGPFIGTNYANGYFGTWGGFIVATIMLSHESALFRKGIDRLATGVSKKPILYLLIASIIETGASIKTCIPQTECSGLYAFAIALGSVSGMICLIMVPFMNRMSRRQARMVAVFFCTWWVIGGMIVTFVKPFQVLGNGYFSVYAAIISSFYLLQENDEV